MVLTQRAMAVDLAHIEALVQGGAPRLALRLLERDQPPASESDPWMAWEKQRFKVYRSQHNWNAIVQRVERLPAGLPSGFHSWALTQAAEARLESKDAEGARRFLRRLIWRGNDFESQELEEPGELSQWRRLVIRSYLLEGNLADAQTALLRYKQDYPDKGNAWQALHAEVLLRAGEPKAAFEVLVGAQSFEARLLRLLAAMRAKLYQPKDVQASAIALAKRLRQKPALARQAWALAAEAALRAQNLGDRVTALEQALNIPSITKSELLFPIQAGDLWLAYEQLAQAVGNTARLLVGEDERWVAQAKRYTQTHSHYARALYAFLTRYGQDESTRLLAHRSLTEGLFATGQAEAAETLYLHSARFNPVSAIPAPVRQRLADKALVNFNIRLAASLMEGLEQPPEGMDADLWNLRRARVQIYAGNYKSAVLLLSDMLDSYVDLPQAMAEAYVQVLFDLQAVDRHAEAVVLLESLFARVDNDQMRREILYWQAESLTASGGYQEAAELYLRSATYNGANGGDPWGQTARFHAAEALGKAGLVNDARSVYLKLLRATTDPKRRAVISRNIQQLWLTEEKTTTP